MQLSSFMIMNTKDTRAFINQKMDEIVCVVNKRRQQLLQHIDAVSSNEIEMQFNTNDANNDTHIIVNALKTYGNDIVPVRSHTIASCAPYVNEIPQDYEYEYILTFGYIRFTTTNPNNIPHDIWLQCLNYFSIYSHLSPDEEETYMEEKQSFESFRQKTQQILDEHVESVIVSDLQQRVNSNDIPCFILDHSKTQNILTQRRRKISFAIDPSNRIISTLKERHDVD
eukprot:1142480_1